MRNLEEEIREILYKINYKKGTTISENIILEKKPLISEPKKITINEGWEKFPCVAKHPRAKWVNLEDGSKAIAISYAYSKAFGEKGYTNKWEGDTYYSNGRVFIDRNGQRWKETYSCDDPNWKVITNNYNLLNKGDYSTKTYGGKPIQSIVGKTLPDGSYTNVLYKGGEYFKDPLSDGYDYLLMPGIVFDDKQARWFRIPLKLRDFKIPELSNMSIEWYRTNQAPNWWQNQNSAKFVYNALQGNTFYSKLDEYSKNFNGKYKQAIVDYQLCEIDDPLAYAIVKKLELIRGHQEAFETNRKATEITIKKVKESLDKNKILKFGMKDTEFFQNSRQDVAFDWKTITPDTLYIKTLQNLLNNAALATNRQTISVSGTFDKPTEILLKQLTEKTEITLNQLESIIKEKYGLNAAALKGPYEGYWQTVADLKSKGFKNTGCYKSDNKNNNGCTNKKQHLDQASWLEMMTLADEIAMKINIALGCQNISTRGGVQNQIPNYSKATAEDLVKNKKFLTDGGKQAKIAPKIDEKDITTLNQLTPEEFQLGQMYVMAKKDGTNINETLGPEFIKQYNPKNRKIEELGRLVNLVSNVQISQARPYHTYFVLDEMYFGGGVALTGKRDETSKNMWNDKTFFPDGPWEFFKTYYETDSPTEIRQSWATYSMEMMVTSCADVLKASPSFLGMDMSNTDVHSVLGYAELGLVALAFIPTPLSPLFFAASTAFGVVDSIVYFAEGDTYMGMMMMGFAMMNIPELKVIIKEASAANKLAQFYKTDLKTAVNTAGKKFANGTATAFEKEMMNELSEVFMKNGGKKQVETKILEVANQNLKTVERAFQINKWGKAKFWVLMSALDKTGKFNAAKTLVTLGGTFSIPIAMDQLYVALYGNTKERQENILFKMWLKVKGFDFEMFKKTNPADANKYFQEYDKELKESTKLERLLQAVSGIMSKMELSQKELQLVMEFGNDFSGFRSSSGGKNIITDEDYSFKLITPKLSIVREGRDSIFEGMEGDSVTEIQKLLKNKWGYNLGTTGVNGDGIDGKFDERMTEKVNLFQRNVFFGLDDLIKKNKIGEMYDESGEPTGLVDKNTLWYLENAKPENLKMPTLKLLPLGVENLTDENAEFFVNNKKYYFYRTSKEEWNEVTQEEYNEKKNKGLKVKEEGNWEKISKLEYLQYTKDGRETKFRENQKELKTSGFESNDLSRRQRKKYEELKKGY